MVKLSFPLYGLTAKGTVGGVLTFSERKSGSQVRFQRKQKDVITSARTAQRSKFLTAKDMWRVYEIGVAQCGYFLCGGIDVMLSSFPKNQRAPKFARFVSDVLNLYF